MGKGMKVTLIIVLMFHQMLRKDWKTTASKIVNSKDGRSERSRLVLALISWREIGVFAICSRCAEKANVEHWCRLDSFVG